MNVFKRSVLYITRKKMKSIIMLFILFGIATAVLSGISIKKAANIARQDSNKDMANTFELQANFAGNFEGTIPENLIDKVSKVEGVKNYDAAIQGAGLDLENVNYIKPEKNAVQYNDDYKYEKLFSVEAHKSSEYDTKFISKSLKLVDGRHIVPTDKGKVLIHKALAEANNLKVGDTIKAKKTIIRECSRIIKQTGHTPKIALISGGRKQDKGRSPKIDHSIDECEQIVQDLKDECNIKHYYILIEEAIKDHANVIIAPDGISGNIIFRSLVLVAGIKSYGALTLKQEKLFIDTSRSQTTEGYVNAITLLTNIIKTKNK